MVGYVFAADLHLANGAWLRRPEIAGDAIRSFEQIIDYCVDHRRALVLGGDVIDVTTPPPNVVCVICRQMDRMARDNLPVYYVQGQHELNRDTPWLSVHHWPQHIHRRLIDIGGELVYGLDWQPNLRLQEELSTVPATAQTLVCHQVWSDFMGVGVTEGSLGEIPYVTKVLTGDYHRRRDLTVTGASGQSISVYSPGSTCMQEISEQPDKYFIDFVNGWPQDVRLETREFYHEQLLTELSLDAFCLQFLAAKSADVRPLLRVTYLDSLPDVQPRVKAAVGDAAHIFWNPIADQRQAVAVDFASLSSAGVFRDIPQAIAALTGDAPEISQGGQRLWQSADLPATIAELRQEFFEQYQQAGASCG